MFPDEIVDRNRAFVTGRAASPLPAVGAIPLAVVTCYDPRLDRLLRPALGLAEGEAFLFRTAGAVVDPGGAILRSLALAVYLFDVRRVLVLGHAACRMAAFPTTEFADAFRRRGVNRSAFGDADLRTWAAAIASPRAGVLATVATIANAPYLPRDLEIAGGVLDEASGRIEIVVTPAEAATVAPPVAEASGAAEEEREPETAPAATPRRPPPPPPPSPVALPPEVADNLRVLAKAVERATSKSGLRQEVDQLRQELAGEPHPVRQLALVQSFLRQTAAETQAARVALGNLHREAQRGGLTDVPHLLAALAGTTGQGGAR